MSATLHHTTLPPRGQDPDKEGAPEPGTLLIEDETLRAGFTQMPNRVLHARNLSRDAKLLYGFLLSYAWQQGSCFPGYAQLCADMGASPSIVRKYMRELETVGLLVQKRRGLGKTNLYTLCSLSRATLEPPASPRRAETDDQDCGSLVSDDQDAQLSAALEGNPCSEEEDSTEKDTDEEEFDSKGTAPHAEHANDGAVRQPTRGQPRDVGHSNKARRSAVSAVSARDAQKPAPAPAAVPLVSDVAPPVPDDQALVVLLTQLGTEFGDRAARSSLTRVRCAGRLAHPHASHACEAPATRRPAVIGMTPEPVPRTPDRPCPVTTRTHQIRPRISQAARTAGRRSHRRTLRSRPTLLSHSLGGQGRESLRARSLGERTPRPLVRGRARPAAGGQPPDTGSLWCGCAPPWPARRCPPGHR